MVEMTNAQITELNGRVLPVLKLITGQDLGVDSESWRAWWTDQLGYVYQSSVPRTKPTYTDMVSVTSPLKTVACSVKGKSIRTSPRVAWNTPAVAIPSP